MAGTEKLTDADCRNAAAGDKRTKLADGGGLSLWIEPSGAKYWRLKYRYSGKGASSIRMWSARSQ
jgi:hypothetical protein